jgi:hypothetical protein
MEYAIRRPSTNATLLTFRPDASSVLIQRIMDAHVVQLRLSLTEPVVFQLGDTVEVFGQTYFLNRLPTVDKEGERRLIYDFTFEAMGYDLAKVQLLFLGDDNSLKEGDFSLMANLEAWVELVVRNANRAGVGGGEWRRGEVDATLPKALTFTAANCLAALSVLAQEFQTEFWVDPDRTIHLSRRGKITPLVFEYGQDNGLGRLQRTNLDGSNVLTRLFAFGSANNLKPDYRNFSQRLKLPEAGGLYLEQNVGLYGVIEHTEIFDDIWPRRTGTVTSIDPDDPLVFVDAGMDFDLMEYLLPGETAKVVFNTGLLAGYEFEIAQGGYNHAQKKFSFKPNEKETALEIPSLTMRPLPGDQYVIVDIFLPQAYVDAAEAELLERAQEYLAQNSVPRVRYQVECDPLHFRRQGIRVQLGDYVRVVDAELGVDVNLRVVGLTRALDNPYAYTLELAEHVTPTVIARQYAQQQQVNRVLRLLDPNVTRPSVLTALPRLEWKTLPLGPGFTSPAEWLFQAVQVARDAQGFVRFRGMATFNGGLNLSLFTLPAGMRPGRLIPYPLQGNTLNIFPDGRCAFFLQPPAGTNVSVEGVAFFAEG